MISSVFSPDLLQIEKKNHSIQGNLFTEFQ